MWEFMIILILLYLLSISSLCTPQTLKPFFFLLEIDFLLSKPFFSTSAGRRL